MIQLKVSKSLQQVKYSIANILLTDITKLHRQLRRLGRRVRERP